MNPYTPSSEQREGRSAIACLFNMFCAIIPPQYLKAYEVYLFLEELAFTYLYVAVIVKESLEDRL